MNTRTIVKTIAGLLVVAAALATRNTDVIYVTVTVLFFTLCLAYAEGCERL